LLLFEELFFKCLPSARLTRVYSFFCEIDAFILPVLSPFDAAVLFACPGLE
jgi:hypothetical protein